MSRRPTASLVVDASVLHAAGATSGRSVHCRDFLVQMYEICHRMVITNEILEEWKRHQSGFSIKWVNRMLGRKKQRKPAIREIPDLRAVLAGVPASDAEMGKMTKDFPLIAAALATDNRIVSLDEEARRLFGRAAATVKHLGRLIWVNPEKVADESPIEWLRRGAPNNPHRRLGA